MQRLGLFLIWVVATVFVTVLAWRVVLAADAQISDPPARGVEALPPSTAPRPTVSVPESTTTSLDLDPEAPPRSTTSEANGNGSTVETSTTTTTSPTTTTTAATTTTTASPASTTTTVAFQTKEIPTDGGTVWVQYRPDEVKFLTVSPILGWQWDLTKERVNEIEGTFTRDGDQIRVRARWSDGEFVWLVD